MAHVYVGTLALPYWALLCLTCMAVNNFKQFRAFCIFVTSARSRTSLFSVPHKHRPSHVRWFFYPPTNLQSFDRRKRSQRGFLRTNRAMLFLQADICINQKYPHAKRKPLCSETGSRSPVATGHFDI